MTLSAGVSSSCLYCGSELTPTLHRQAAQHTAQHGTAHGRTQPCRQLHVKTRKPAGGGGDKVTPTKMQLQLPEPSTHRMPDDCIVNSCVIITRMPPITARHSTARALTCVPACRPVPCSSPVQAARHTPATHGRGPWAGLTHPPAYLGGGGAKMGGRKGASRKRHMLFFVTGGRTPTG
jgi:hypothetical protein